MKARKALKRLKRVDTLLTRVIDQYESATAEVKAFLDAARSSITSASDALAALPVEKPTANGKRAPQTFTSATRKRLSIAAKRRWALAKRNGANSLAAPSPKKTKVRSTRAAV